MKKAELIARIAEVEGCTKKAAGEQLDVIVNIIADALVDGEEVSLSGFGKFTVTERAARTGRNPQTGETIDIPASKSPKFKASSTLKAAVNA